MKFYARRAQFGATLDFKKPNNQTDGSWRTSPRGWFSFAHTNLALLFVLEHLWHAGRALFKDIWTGLTFQFTRCTAFGLNVKLGDSTTRSARWNGRIHNPILLCNLINIPGEIVLCRRIARGLRNVNISLKYCCISSSPQSFPGRHHDIYFTN